ncbi:hypothetical protein BLA29_007704, partial [Euroglyphus maynei]
MKNDNDSDHDENGKSNNNIDDDNDGKWLLSNNNNDKSNVQLQQQQSLIQKLFQSRFDASSITSTIPSATMTSTTTSSSGIINDDIIKLHPIYDGKNDRNCQSPFCKLKRRQHLHCNICNQAFTSYDRLIPHFTKHQSIMMMTPGMTPTSRDARMMDDVQSSSSQSQSILNSTNLTNEFFQLFLNNLMNFPSTTTTTSTTTASPMTTMNPGLSASSTLLQNSSKAEFPNPVSGNHRSISNSGSIKRRHSFSSDSSGSQTINDNNTVRNCKKQKQTNENNDDRNRASDHETSPNGYARFRFNEDCTFQSC